MPYYPKSQITPNLYTNGGEFVFINNKEIFYTGYYYKLSTGKQYTGKNPNGNQGIELIPVEDNVLKTSLDNDAKPPSLSDTPSGANVVNLVELDLQGDDELYYYDSGVIFGYPPLTNFQRRLLPPSYSTIPTPKDYQIGEFQRYFAKKTNELIYIEVSKETYNKFINQDPKVAFDLYNPISLPWNLTGDEKQVYQSNKNIVELVERENNWYGFTSYFQKDFSKYYLAS